MREREGGDKGEREREKVATQGKTITYPSCTPGAHFHPSKRGKESHRLRYANYPLRGTCTYTDIHANTRAHILRVVHAYACVPSIYTGVFLILSTNITASPRDRGRVLALWVQHDGNTMKQTGERRVCACTHTGWHARAKGKGERERGKGREKERDRYAMVKNI